MTTKLFSSSLFVLHFMWQSKQCIFVVCFFSKFYVIDFNINDFKLKYGTQAS